MSTPRAPTPSRSSDLRFAVGVARATGGALFFALPLLMTMEMWSLGFSMDPARLAILTLLVLPLLVALARHSGFEEGGGWDEATLDGLVGYGVGFVTSLGVLALFRLVEPGMTAREVVGKVSLQAVPAGFGAVLAASQFGRDGGDGGEMDGDAPGEAGYGVELLYMLAGALFFAFNVAPTEEMILIAYRMGAGRCLLLVAVSLALMHAFVYAVEFRGGHGGTSDHPGWVLFLRFTLVGYAVAILTSAYVLWTFGRFEDHAPSIWLLQSVVLAFPAALGAAAARLVL